MWIYVASSYCYHRPHPSIVLSFHYEPQKRLSHSRSHAFPIYFVPKRLSLSGACIPDFFVPKRSSQFRMHSRFFCPLSVKTHSFACVPDICPKTVNPLSLAYIPDFFVIKRLTHSLSHAFPFFCPKTVTPLSHASLFFWGPTTVKPPSSACIPDFFCPKTVEQLSLCITLFFGPKTVKPPSFACIPDFVFVPKQ